MAQFITVCFDCKSELIKGNKRACSDGKYRCVYCNAYRNDQIKSERRKTDPRYKAYMREYSLGITDLEFQNILKKQNNLCAICKDPLDLGKFTCADHDHETGKARGILCSGCNIGLGKFKDSVQLLTQAIGYLRLYGKT